MGLIRWWRKKKSVQELQDAIVDWMDANRQWAMLSACDEPRDILRAAANDAHRSADRVAYLTAIAFQDQLPEKAQQELKNPRSWAIPAHCLEWKKSR